MSPAAVASAQDLEVSARFSPLEGLGDEEGGADAAVGDDEGFGDDGAGGADVEDGLDAFGLNAVGADGLAGDADGLHEADDFDFLVRRNDGALGFEGFAVDGGVDDGVAGDVELVALNDDAEAGEDDGGVDAGGLGGDAEDVLAVDFLGGGALGNDGAAGRVDGFECPGRRRRRSWVGLRVGLVRQG